jgi:DNA-binding response OmpR family regulator
MSRILVVEDDPDIALMLAEDLRMDGYEVEVADNGRSAAARGQEPGWDLILLDVMLPHKDGFEVCRQLRRSGIRTPVILLTARSQEAEKLLGFELGADDYVTKPFSPPELRARIGAVLRRSGPAEQAERLEFGDVEVDAAAGEVRRGGVRIEVTPIEFKLLATFLRNRGRVLSREQLIRNAWGPNTYVTDRAVDTHIVNLRRKVEPDPAGPRYIVSVRSMGYRMEHENPTES